MCVCVCVIFGTLNGKLVIDLNKMTELKQKLNSEY